MSARSILSHTAIFLCGIFIALLISTAHLTTHDESRHDFRTALTESAGWGSGTRGGGGGKGIQSSSKFQNDLQEERRKTRELQDRVSKLQGDDNGGSKSSSSTAAEGGGMERILRERLLQGFTERDKIRDSRDEGGRRNPDLCSILPRPTPTALSLWSDRLSCIFDATQHPADRPEYIFHDFTAQLLRFMTPDRIQRSVKTLPLDWSPVERSMDVLHRRWKAIQTEVDNYAHRDNEGGSNGSGEDTTVPPDVMKRINDDPKLPRKLNVLVMGGSVTMGVVCHINPERLRRGSTPVGTAPGWAASRPSSRISWGGTTSSNSTRSHWEGRIPRAA